MKPLQIARKFYDAYFPLSKEDAMGIATSFVFWTTLYIIVEQLPLPFVPKKATLTRS